MILVLILILGGAYTFQYINHETPCPLCFLQRLMMIGAATAALMNLRYTIHTAHYGLIILSSIFGLAVSLRQIALHICMNFPTFSKPIFGYDLFVWAFMIFYTLLFSTALLNIIYSPDGSTSKEEMAPFAKIMAALLLLITFANGITTYLQCGFSPCVG